MQEKQEYAKKDFPKLASFMEKAFSRESNDNHDFTSFEAKNIRLPDLSKTKECK